ncbi:MAG: hypothetical protein ACOYJ6_05455 [Caulobacterales bacterium]|jgi:hypothetical protein
MTATPLASTTPRTLTIPAEAVVAAGLALLAFSLGLYGPFFFNDGDTLWHLRAGELMLDQGAVLHADPFSFSFAGQKWTTHEWLAEVLSALAWRGGGAGGVAAFHALAAGLLVLILFRAAAPGVRTSAWVLALVVAFGCLLPGYLARPHFLVLPLLALWTWALIDARGRGEAPPLVLALVLWLWANLHGSFIFGAALAAFFAFEALVADLLAWRRTVWRWSRFAGACLVAVIATPHLIDGLLFPFQLKQIGNLVKIVEWRPMDWALPQPAHLAVLGLGALLLHPKGRPGFLRLLLLAGLFWMMAQHQRHQMLFAIVGLVVMAEPLARIAQGKFEPRAVFGPALALFLAGAVLLTGVRIATGPAAMPETSTYHPAAIAALPADLRAQPGLNDYGFGGALIFSGVKVFVDSRVDMYGDAFMNPYYAMLADQPGALNAGLARWGFRWAMLFPGEPAVLALQQRGWRVLFQDERAVVLAAP